MNSNAHENTVLFLLSKAFNTLFYPRQIVIEHSFADGLFCHGVNWEVITQDEILQLGNQINSWIDGPIPIELKNRNKDEIREDLIEINSLSKLELLNQWKGNSIPIISFGEYWDLQIGDMTEDKIGLKIFSLLQYNNGFIIRFQNNEGKISSFQDQPKLFSIIEEHEQWGSILGVSTIRELNELIRNKKIREMIWVAEGLHEKKISTIADNMVKNFPEKRIISIAGPSSAGKTTFTKRLAIQLRVLGFTPIQVSMDDYYLDRTELVKDKNGLINYESIQTLNIDLLCQRLRQLLNGEKIRKRSFDFVTGTGRDLDQKIQIGKWGFILLEGIHGLNPILPKRLGAGKLQRVYVSAITQMNIDANHRISTSDNRLLRRLVRDHKYRGYSPEQTFERWPMVRAGEDKNIFPFQEEADLMFNSSLVYEFPVLAKFALPLLENVDPASEFVSEYLRLKTLMSFFEKLDEEMVPGNSLIREFIGKSDFEY